MDRRTDQYEQLQLNIGQNSDVLYPEIDADRWQLDAIHTIG